MSAERCLSFWSDWRLSAEGLPAVDDDGAGSSSVALVHLPEERKHDTVKNIWKTHNRLYYCWFIFRRIHDCFQLFSVHIFYKSSSVWWKTEKWQKLRNKKADMLQKHVSLMLFLDHFHLIFHLICCLFFLLLKSEMKMKRMRPSVKIVLTFSFSEFWLFSLPFGRAHL